MKTVSSILVIGVNRAKKNLPLRAGLVELYRLSSD